MQHCIQYFATVHAVFGRPDAWAGGRPDLAGSELQRRLQMPASKPAILASDETAEAAEIVEKFLVASMVPDPETAARYVADDLKLTFTGGRRFSHPRESTAFN